MEINRIIRQKLNYYFGDLDKAPERVKNFIQDINDYLKSTENSVSEKLTGSDNFKFIKNNPLLNIIFNSYHDIILLIDDNDVIIDFLADLNDLYRSPDQFLGKRVQDILIEDVTSKILSAIADVRDSGTAMSIDYSMMVKNEKNYFEARLFSISENKIIMVIRNITREKTAYYNLYNSNEKYRFITENIADVIWIINFNYMFEYVSPSITSLTGYSVDEFINKSIRDMMPPSSLEVAIKVLDEELEIGKEMGVDSNRSRHLEVEIYRKDGSSIWVESKVKNLCENNNKVGFIGVLRDITERKQAEEKLREREEFQRRLIETTTDVIYVLDINGKFTYISPRFEEITGHPIDELMGHLFTEFIALKQVNKVVDSFNKGLAGKNVPIYEVDIKFSNGDTFPVELNVSTLYDKDGKPVGRLGVGRDIRFRLETERALRESEEKYRTILENMDDAYYEVDLKGNITFLNNSYCRILGYSKEELIGKSYKKILTEDEHETLYKEFNDIYNHRNPMYLTPRKFLLKDGSIRIAEGSVSLRYDNNGNVIGFSGLVRDVTERIESAKALKESEEKYRTILENIEDAYIENDLSGKITFFNDSLVKLTGYTREEILGSDFRAVTDDRHQKEIFGMFKNIYITEKPGRMFSWEITRKDGEKRYIEASASLIRDRDGNKIGFRSLVRDITDRKKVEQDLKESEEKLRLRNEAIESDLKAAQLIQKALVFSKIPEVSEVKIDYRYLPLDAVGGDYFSFTPLIEGGLGVFIGDVSSHGVTAALFLSLIKATSDRICRDYALKPNEYIQGMNKELLGNMPLSFLTAIYGVFRALNNSTISFTFSCAGHPPPLLYRASSKEVTFINSRGTLIGMFDDIKSNETAIYLEKGDRIFLYTDGIPETMNNKREIWSYDRMPELIRDAFDSSLSTTLDNVIGKINKHRGNNPLSDDIILLGFEV